MRGTIPRSDIVKVRNSNSFFHSLTESFLCKAVRRSVDFDIYIVTALIADLICLEHFQAVELYTRLCNPHFSLQVCRILVACC